MVIDEELEFAGEVLRRKRTLITKLGASNDDFLIDERPLEGEVNRGAPVLRLDDSEPPREENPEIIAFDFVSKPAAKNAPRQRGETSLKITQGRQHLMRHTPKNPFCETCIRAKMHSVLCDRTGDQHIDARKFGGRLTADHLITSNGREVGIEKSRVALVIRDVATEFRYAYPSARKTSHQ